MASEILGKEIKEIVQGDVQWDKETLKAYSTNQSMYRVKPMLVTFPKDDADVINIIRIARKYACPVTPRSGGTSLAGASLNTGIIIDFKKYMNQILDFVEEDGQHYVICQPGVNHKALQEFIKVKGYFLPPDPSSAPICCIGGNVATKSSGAHSVRYGTFDDYVEILEFITIDGILVNTSNEETIPENIQYRLLRLKEKISADDETLNFYKKREGVKSSSGYNLPALIRYSKIGDFLAHILVSSVGTLGVFTKIKLRIEEIPEGVATSLIYFRQLDEAMDSVKGIKEIGAVAIELLNYESLKLVRKENPKLGIPEEEVHMLLIEFQGLERFDQIEKLERMIVEKGYDIYNEVMTELDEEKQHKLWAVRHAILPTLMKFTKGTDLKAHALIEDIGLKIQYLAPFIREATKIFQKYNLIVGMYGHVGTGTIHLRPLINLKDPKHIEMIPHLVDDVYDLLFTYGGTITSEHGMGRNRTMYLEKEYGSTIYNYMKDVKVIFDPKNLLNPKMMICEDCKITDNLNII
ncbi:FAD-binding oxidoreductase [Candidatus Borrarchaeum sp.]|uniref:FAD-binding oxidoreductase n=1 Tax=Candidatus Borrarchaeum sp. TaxID=2846742 RepID=UPI00257A5171|nr:FAD-binding oxidoreductase [Candidatus Borrarchaeum sp.]